MADGALADEWCSTTFGVHPASFMMQPTQSFAAPAAPASAQAMTPDCKPVHGKVKGPANHLLCGTHGHILDITAKTIIAANIKEYDAKDASENKSHEDAAAAGKKADARKAADDHQREEFHKSIGLLPIDVILTVETVDGPPPPLKITMTATNTAGGNNVGQEGFVKLDMTSGISVAKKQDIPLVGTATFEVNATSGDKIALHFTQASYDVTKSRVLKLHAVERALTGSTTSGSNQGSNKSHTKGSHTKANAGISIGPVSGGGEYGQDDSDTDGSNEGTSDSDTLNAPRHSAVYDVKVI